jgi:hypothetical protein
MAAQDGTTNELGDGIGLGEAARVGVGDGLADGPGEALASPVGDGLLRAAAAPAGAQPATAKRATTAASLNPTGNRNARTRADVTPGIACTPFTINAPVSGLNERRVYRMKATLAFAVILLSACLDTPPPLTADVNVSASQTDSVGGRAQLVVNVTNTGPAIPHIGLTFVSADKWYERHTLTDPGGCTVATDYSALDCGDLAAGASATFSITGTASQAGTFHYELELRELVRPFHYVNDHPNGADVQAWDETISAA